MSLEKAYRALVESAELKESGLPVKGETKETAEQKAQPGSTKRPQDQAGEVPVQGSTQETADQKKKPGSAKRPQDQAAAVPVQSGTEAPAECKVSAPDMEGEFEVQEEQKEATIGERLAETAQFSLSDELGALLESADLGEEFKDKAVTIFEAAVAVATEKHIAKLEEQAAAIIAEEVEAVKAQLDEQVEEYLDYVVEQWMEENQVALQSTARATIAESFMADMAELLTRYNVELPEEKVDMFEAAQADRDELDAALSEAAAEIVSLRDQLAGMQKTLALEGFVAQMTDVEAEKIRSLAESVEFESAEDFVSKLETLAENFAPATSKSTDLIIEDVSGEVESAQQKPAAPVVNEEMAAYLAATRKLSAK